MFALIWLKRQHGSGSRGARRALQEGSQMELLIKGFSYLSAPMIGLGCMNLFLFAAVSFCVYLSLSAYFFGWQIGCKLLSYNALPILSYSLFSSLSIFVYCLFGSFLGCQQCQLYCNSPWHPKLCFIGK